MADDPCCLISKMFDDKILLQCSKLPPPAIPPTDQAPITPPPLLSSFASSTEAEVRRVIILPQTLLVIRTLFQPVSSNLVWMYSSLSLSEGSFPTTFSFKHARSCQTFATYLKMNSPVIVQSQIWILFQRFWNVSFMLVYISTHLESFPSIIPFQYAYWQFLFNETALRIQNDLLLAINKKIQPWYFSICLPLLIRLIIKFSCPGYPLFMVSQAQHWIWLLSTSWIEHNQFLYSSIPLLLPTFSQVYHRILSLVVFSFHCIQALSVKSSQRLQFYIIYMLY